MPGRHTVSGVSVDAVADVCVCAWSVRSRSAWKSPANSNVYSFVLEIPARFHSVCVCVYEYVSVFVILCHYYHTHKWRFRRIRDDKCFFVVFLCLVIASEVHSITNNNNNNNSTAHKTNNILGLSYQFDDLQFGRTHRTYWDYITRSTKQLNFRIL